MRLVLTGPPGAGKGTQGELLVEWLHAPRYSTGDMLRSARSAGTELGERARSYMDAGELVPDEVILGIVAEALDRDDAWDGFIFDGFPRTAAQARGLSALLRRRGQSLDAVIQLDVPEAVLVERLTRRRVCGACGQITRVSEAENGASCPACGGSLTQRSDDRPETVRRRLQVYRDETEPVLSWYRAAEVPVLTVDGTGSVESVHRAIRAKLAA
ncbi:MAG: adenylate kinase [Gemmatimonadota bacterium]